MASASFSFFREWIFFSSVFEMYSSSCSACACWEERGGRRKERRKRGGRKEGKEGERGEKGREGGKIGRERGGRGEANEYLLNSTLFRKPTEQLAIRSCTMYLKIHLAS